MCIYIIYSCTVSLIFCDFACSWFTTGFLQARHIQPYALVEGSLDGLLPLEAFLVASKETLINFRWFGLKETATETCHVRVRKAKPGKTQ